MIHLLLADDEPIVRSGLTMRLSLEPDLVIVGEAADGEQAVALALALKPDIVLMDVNLPKLDGVSATGHIRQQAPDIAVIILTLYGDATTRAGAAAAGAAAFIEKADGELALLGAIRRVGHRALKQQVQRHIDDA